jgi:hypothetical protein
MPRIHFAQFRLPNPDHTEEAIRRRLRLHLAGLKFSKSDRKPPMDADGTLNEVQYQALLEKIDLPWQQTKSLQRRAKTLGTAPPSHFVVRGNPDFLPDPPGPVPSGHVIAFFSRLYRVECGRLRSAQLICFRTHCGALGG